MFIGLGYTVGFSLSAFVPPHILRYAIFMEIHYYHKDIFFHYIYVCVINEILIKKLAQIETANGILSFFEAYFIILCTY